MRNDHTPVALERWIPLFSLATFVMWTLHTANPSAYLRTELVYETIETRTASSPNISSSSSEQLDFFSEDESDGTTQTDPFVDMFVERSDTEPRLPKWAVQGANRSAPEKLPASQQEHNKSANVSASSKSLPTTCENAPRVIGNATLSDYGSVSVVGRHRKVLSRLTFFIDKKPFIPKNETVLFGDISVSTNDTHYATCRFMDHQWSFHFPHVMQQFYRCWSFWRIYPDNIPIFVPTDNGRYWNSAMNSNFTSGVMNLLPRLGIHLVDRSNVAAVAVVDGSQPNHTSSINKKGSRKPPPHPQSISVRPAALTTFPDAPHYQAPSVEDMHSLRDSIFSLLSEGKNTAKQESPRFLQAPSELPRIVLLNRKKNRHLGNAQAIIDELQAHFGVDVPELYFEKTSFQYQAQTLANIDILVTPHGAQETGIIFMPNCGGVLEVFPDQYYYPKFFGSLAATAGLAHGFVYMAELPPEPILDEKSFYGYNISWRDIPSMCPPASGVREGVELLVEQWRRCRQKEEQAKPK